MFESLRAAQCHKAGLGQKQVVFLSLNYTLNSFLKRRRQSLLPLMKHLGTNTTLPADFPSPDAKTKDVRNVFVQMEWVPDMARAVRSVEPLQLDTVEELVHYLLGFRVLGFGILRFSV